MTEKYVPNIILIVLDTVGASHLSLYGYERSTSPKLERFAEESLVFTRCFSPSCWTIPAHASIFTGLLPSQHLAHESNPYLDKNYRHLTSILKQTGYKTYGISSNGLVSEATGICKDFDIFIDYGARDSELLLSDVLVKKSDDLIMDYMRKAPTKKDKIFAALDYLMRTKNFESFFKTAYYYGKLYSKDIINPRPCIKSSVSTKRSFKNATNIIHQHNEKYKNPFFLFINVMEGHEVYNPPQTERTYSAFNEKQDFRTDFFYLNNNFRENKELIYKYISLYDDEIKYLDKCIGHFINSLYHINIIKDTIIIITSDHGEAFGEKGIFNHKFALYNNLIWVPLIIRFPKNYMKQGINKSLIFLNDIFSTILDIVESPFPRPKSSISLFKEDKRKFGLAQIIDTMPWIRMLKSFEEDHVTKKNYLNFVPQLSVVTADGFKVIKDTNNNYKFYDLEKDFFENKCLSDDHSNEKIRMLRNLIDLQEKNSGFLESQKEISI